MSYNTLADSFHTKKFYHVHPLRRLKASFLTVFLKPLITAVELTAVNSPVTYCSILHLTKLLRV